MCLTGAYVVSERLVEGTTRTLVKSEAHRIAFVNLLVTSKQLIVFVTPFVHAVARYRLASGTISFCTAPKFAEVRSERYK